MGELFSHFLQQNSYTLLLSKIKASSSQKNQGLKALPYIGSSLWNNQDKFLKISASLNAFKHDIKDHYFWKENKKES